MVSMRMVRFCLLGAAFLLSIARTSIHHCDDRVGNDTGKPVITADCALCDLPQTLSDDIVVGPAELLLIGFSSSIADNFSEDPIEGHAHLGMDRGPPFIV